MQNARACNVSVHNNAGASSFNASCGDSSKTNRSMVLIRENRNRLDMEGLREHIDRRCLQSSKPAASSNFTSRAHVTEVAAHIRHAQGRRLGDGADNFSRGHFEADRR